MADQVSRASMEQEQRLIDNVRKHRCLWDKNFKKFKNKTARDAAWRATSVIVFGDGAEVTIAANARRCSNLWTTLRGQVMKYRRRTELCTGTKELYFRHAENMRFLFESNKESDEGTYSSFDYEIKQGSPQDSDITNESEKFQLVDFTVLEPQSLPQVATRSRMATTSHRATSSQQLSRAKVTSVDRLHTKLARMSEVDHPGEQEPLELSPKGTDEEDEVQTFGRFVSQKLRAIRKKNRRSYLDVQFKISSILHEAEVSELNN